MAKDGDLTFEEAVEKVMDLEPELYEKAEAGARGARGQEEGEIDADN